MWIAVLALAALLASAQGYGVWESVETDGRPDDLTSVRIVNGYEAVPGQFPHQVGIWIYIGTSKHFCGGSILTDRIIITAAHCAVRGRSFTVVAGAHDIRDASELSRQVAQVDGKMVHERYNKAEQMADDIALLRLEKPLMFNTRVQPVRLPKVDKNRYWRTTAVMSGWGLNNTEAVDISPKLRYVESRVVSNWYCRARFFLRYVRHSNICVSGWWKKGTCQGDSGGPMVVYEADGKPTLVGITSFGIKYGCESSWPNVFTRVTSYLDWIRVGLAAARDGGGGWSDYWSE